MGNLGRCEGNMSLPPGGPLLVGKKVRVSRGTNIGEGCKAPLG